MNWQEVKNRVSNIQARCPSKVSEKRSILKIMDKAEEWGISPEYAGASSISNLEFAINECNRAIRWEDREFLAEIFHKCATLSTVKLRLALHIPELERVDFEQDGKNYLFIANEKQFSRIQNATQLQIKFNPLPVTRPTIQRVTQDTYDDVQ